MRLMALGIDLGSSNTVAFLRRDGAVEPLLFDGGPLLPSAVFCAPDGSLLVGRDALHSARARPEHFEGNPKQRIDEGTVFLGRDVPVEELLGALLRRVAAEAERVGGRPVDHSTLSHPASWGAERQQTLLRAARRAGLGAVRLVPEPVAAAAQHVRRLAAGNPSPAAVPPGDLVVYDLGAGTFDVAVVRHAPGLPMRVLAHAGLDDLGGNDLDAALVALLRQRPAVRERAEWHRLEHPRTVADQQVRRQLWDDVRAAKEMLSRTGSTTLYLPLIEADEVLTRAELEAVAAPLLQRTVDLVRSTIAGFPGGQTVVLVGGATRMPLVAGLLQAALGAPPVAIEQPELVVAAGCLDPLALPPGPAVPAMPPSVPAAPAGPFLVPVPPPVPQPAAGAPAPPMIRPPMIWPPVAPPGPGQWAPPGPGQWPAVPPAPPGQWAPGGAGQWGPPRAAFPAPAGAFATVELIELSLPGHAGVTLRGHLRGDRDSVQYVFPTDQDGTLLVFSGTDALARYAAAEPGDPLLATPPWQVRTDPSGALTFDFDLVAEHLRRPPEDWLPSFLCRCRDLAAQLAIFLELDEAQTLLEEHTPIDEADSVLRRTGGGPVGRAGRRRLAHLDHDLLTGDWSDLIGLLDAAARTVE